MGRSNMNLPPSPPGRPAASTRLLVRTGVGAYHPLVDPARTCQQQAVAGSRRVPEAGGVLAAKGAW